ncbi:hypothetical protein H8356DRAFT_972969 [Neocallimastix lanati (nom. inval.)]|nr:hypothetical protein H8356DRAFT_972969 [Neocallimastix sp. JGI-2020a]
MDFYTLVERIIQVSMVVFPVSPYYSQYKKIKNDPNGRKGFSRHVCGFLLMANIFKIFFWYGKRFDVTLLCQAIAMFTVQFILLHASKLDVRIIYLKTGKEWIYKSFTLYLVLIITISFILSIFGHFFNDSYIYLEIIGFIGVSIEAAVPIPQAIRNYKNKSVKGFSKVVLIVWYTGDTCKVCYHGFMHTPHQFFICGLFQLFMDVVITSQWIHYSKSGNTWYDKYARKYGLYYENNDLLEDDDSCNDYSYDESHKYKKYKALSTSSGNDIIISSTSSDITTESSQSTVFNNNRPDNDNNEIYNYIASSDKQENEKYISSQSKKSKEETNKISNIKTYSENKNSDINCNLINNNTDQYILRKNSHDSTKSTYSSDGIEGSDTFVEKESDIIEQKLYSISSSSSHESNNMCKKSKIKPIDEEMKSDEYSKLNPSLNKISFKKMTSTTNNNSKNNQSSISITKHNNNNNNNNNVIPIHNDFIDNHYSIKPITTVNNKVKTIVKKKNFSISNLKNEKSNNIEEELKTSTNLPNSTQSSTNATTINIHGYSPFMTSSIKNDNATIFIDNFSDTEKNSKDITNNILNNKNNITININNKILRIKNSYHSIFSAPAIIETPIPLYSQHEPPEFSILLSDHPNVHNKINKKLNTSLTKTSTLAIAINNSKALNTVSSILTSPFSSGLSKINSKFQNSKKAKAKADAEAAFQAEIDMAFDGDDFERDIRDGIGFKSLKNKSFNRKKESNSRNPSATSTNGIDFKTKLKNWTGFAIIEVV